MYIGLINPPLCDPTQPPYSIAALAASIRSQRHHTVGLFDLNLILFRMVLDKSIILDQILAIKSKPSLIDKFLNLSQIPDITKQQVINNIEKPHRLFKMIENVTVTFHDSKNFFNGVCYSRAIHDLRVLCLLFSFRSLPSYFELCNLFCSYKYEETELLWESAITGCQNPFYQLIQRWSVGFLRKRDLDCVGISINFETQILCALTLIAEIRKEKPNLPIILGGALMPYIGKVFVTDELLRGQVDGVVVNEGQTAVIHILERLSRKKRTKDNLFDGIPNTITPSLTELKKYYFEDLDALPMPDFDGLPLESYLSPKKVIPLVVSKGCYWGQCAYCDLMPGTKRYRSRNALKVLNDVLQLSEKWKTSFFTFLGDSLHPEDAKFISQALLKSGRKVAWSTDVRLEQDFTPELTKLMREAGCVLVAPGLEMLSDRVLSVADKGLTRYGIESTIQCFAGAGIHITAQAMMGFPGETVEEMQITHDFLTSRHAPISFVLLSQFLVLKDSRIGRKPHLFGIRVDRNTWKGFNYSTYEYQGTIPATSTPHHSTIKKLFSNIRKRHPDITFPYNGSDAHALLLCSMLTFKDLKKFIYEGYLCHQK
jgi:radical SAM superfamily enzyme YgiQ (UPF0313 family)